MIGLLQILLLAVVSLAVGEQCNIRRFLSDELKEIGVERLLDFDYPIIFQFSKGNDAEEEERFTLLREFTRIDSLRENYGATVVELSSSNAYSHGKLRTTLALYLNTISSSGGYISASNDVLEALPSDQIYYLFGGNYDGVFSEITNVYRVRDCGDHCEIAGAKTVGIGGIDSGVAFHFHGPGFAEVIHGRKEWFFYPRHLRSLVDRVGNAANMTTQHWKQCIVPLLKAQREEDSGCSLPVTVSAEERKALVDELQECTIGQDELLFFPAQWMHATLNTDLYNVFISTFMDPQLVRHRPKSTSKIVKLDI